MTAIENDQGNPEGGKIQSNGDDCEQFRNQLSNSFESFDVLYIDPTMSSSTTDAGSLQHIYHDVQSSISDAENAIYHVVDRSTPASEQSVGSTGEDKCEDLAGDDIVLGSDKNMIYAVINK